ncbi:MAG: hypothetical protein F7C08_02965 [Desulfurococcales archaeon]|nr:hypothetical protein [Desulfurococcales archaeon]
MGLLGFLAGISSSEGWRYKNYVSRGIHKLETLSRYNYLYLDIKEDNLETLPYIEV